MTAADKHTIDELLATFVIDLDNAIGERGTDRDLISLRDIAARVWEQRGNEPRWRIRFRDARDHLRELLATRTEQPTVEEMRRWWDSSALLVPEVIGGLEAWEKAGQDVVDMFDPMKASASPHVLVLCADVVNKVNAGLRSDLDAARAALRREQDARALLRVEIDRVKAERDEAQMLCFDARIQAMDRGASYQAVVAELAEAREQHRSNVEGFESALAQEQYEKSILEQVDAERCAQLEAARVAARAYAARVDELGLAADDNDPKVMATAGPIGKAMADLYIALGIFDEEVERRRAQAPRPSQVPAVRFFAARVRDVAPDATVALLNDEANARGMAAQLTAYPDEADGYLWSDAGTAPDDWWCVVDAAPPPPCCPQASHGTHDIGCRGGGKVH